MLDMKCSRCKRLYLPYGRPFEKTEKVPEGSNAVSVFGGQDARVFYLCPDCLKGLVKYLTDPDSEVV